jgi:O-antigen/teichoic acid export membrane protein
LSTVLTLGRWLAAGRSGAAAVVQTIAANALIVMVTLITGVIAARFLGPAGRGEQAAMVMWPQLLAYSMTLGIPMSLRYYLRHYPAEQPQLLTAALALAGALGLVAALAGTLIIPRWLSQYDPVVITFTQGLLVFVPVQMVALVFIALLHARGEFTSANHVALIPPTTTLVILIILAALRHLNPYSSTLAYVVPSALSLLWMLWRLHPILALQLRGFTLSAQRLLHYGTRSYGIDLLSMLSMQIDQVLVVGLLTAGSMGIYTVALSVSRVLAIIHTSVNTVLFPKATSLDTGEIIALTNRTARISTAMTALAALVLIIAAPLVIPLFYGRAFLAAVPITQLLVIEVVLAGTTGVLGQAFLAAGRPTIVTLLQAAGLGTCIPLLLWLIPRHGLLGAAIALLCSTTLRLVLVSLAYPALLRAPLPNLFLSKSDVSHLRAALSAALHH